MQSHPLVPVIRCHLRLAALAILCILWPEMALGAFPLMMLPNSCCCTNACTIYSDDYSTDKTGTDYSIRSGSFSVSAGVLSTSSASALIVANTAASVSATAVNASTSINCATTSDIGRLIILYTNDNTYWFAEIQPGATDGTLKLFQRSGGTNTQRGTTQTMTGYTGGAKTVAICYAYGEVIAGAGGAIASFATTQTAASTQAGLGTGAGSSSVTFDDFSFTKHRKDDATCNSCGTASPSTCTFCSNSAFLTPDMVQVEVSGVADAHCTCTDANGTYAITIASCGGFATWTGVDCAFGGLVTFSWLSSTTQATVTSGCTGAGFPCFCDKDQLATATGTNTQDCFLDPGLGAPVSSPGGTTSCCDFSGAGITAALI